MIEDVARGRSSGPTVVVTTEDETVLHCTPREIISPAGGRRSRWVLVEENGAEYLGPEYAGFTSMRDILKTINDWWTTKKSRE